MATKRRKAAPPDTEFEQFYQAFGAMLDAVVIPNDALTYPPADGTAHFSWDRKAAYLLWSSIDGEEAKNRIRESNAQTAQSATKRRRRINQLVLLSSGGFGIGSCLDFT